MTPRDCVLVVARRWKGVVVAWSTAFTVPVATMTEYNAAAPARWGAILVPRAAQNFARWVDRRDRSYVTLKVRTSVADAMIAKICAIHPSVRCISRNPVAPPSIDTV